MGCTRHGLAECTYCTRHWHVVHSSNTTVSRRGDLMTSQHSLADQIEKTGHALTANELGILLAVSHKTLFKQAKAGRIPSFRIGTCVRFDPFTVAKWLRKQ